METDKFKNSWNKNKIKLQEHYPNLTEEDLMYEAGKEEELLLKLERKLKKTRQEIRNWLHLMG